VYHDLGLGVHVGFFDAVARALEEPRDHLRATRAAELAGGPEQTRRDFVTNADNRKAYAVGGEGVHDRVRVRPYLRYESVGRESGPRRRFGLMGWVGPCIAVVKIEIDFEAGCLCTLRQADVVVKIVIAVGGVHPDALPHGVDARVLQYGFQGLSLARSILVGSSGFLFNEKRGPVYAFVCKTCENRSCEQQWDGSCKAHLDKT